MDRQRTYEAARSLAREKRVEHGVQTGGFGLRQLREIYRAEGISLTGWPYKMRKVKAVYFREDGHAHVMYNKHIPDEPRLFALVHELKHHYLDADGVESQPIGCLTETYDQGSDVREIAAEVFAAEFLFPEEEFRQWAEGYLQGRVCTSEDLVMLKQECPARVSYTFLRKAMERLGYAPASSLQVIGIRKLEEQLLGVPFYRRIRSVKS